MPLEDDILEFLIFCSFQVYKSVKREKNDFSRWPFEGCTDMHQKYSRMGRQAGAGWQVTQKAIERIHFFLLLHFSISVKNEISKNEKCHLQQLFQITRNPVWIGWFHNYFLGISKYIEFLMERHFYAIDPKRKLISVHSLLDKDFLL